MKFDSRALAELLGRNGVAAAWLFGSRARNTEGPLSDHDIAVLPSSTVRPEDRLRLRLELTAELSPLLGPEPVDVVLADEASPLLAHRVLREGVLLHCSDPVQRVRFEVRALREYFDTRPLDEEYFLHLRQHYPRNARRG